ncbi:MAG: hypothetical protein ACR2J6_00750 [Thermoleophilaceae bacterium]
MSRPAAASIAKAALALMGCLVVLGWFAHLITGSASPPGGLAVSFSGGAFERAADHDGPPAMTIRGLKAGDATSGTVTVRNRGPGSRWFWLSQAGLSERLGDAGGRLSESLQLTVLDVSDVGSPASVYRGPATSLGARPLGFLAPGASRTYSFTADLPVTRPPGAAGATDPYRGAKADIDYAWRTIAGAPASAPSRPGARGATKPRRGQPAAGVPAPRHRDTSAPRVRFSAPPRQQVLGSATLAVRVRCNEACRIGASALVTGPDERWTATVTTSQGMKRSRTLQVHLGPKALATVRRALFSGRVARIRVAVRTRDRTGNRGAGRYTMRLLPRPR